MKIEHWHLSKLKPYAKNPRDNDKAVPRMVASIKEFGFAVPVLARKNGEVIDGHLRIKAAIAMEWAEKIPVVLCDGWSKAQVKAFRLLVNRSVSWADWDMEMLAAEFAEIKALDFDLGMTGFDAYELASSMPGEVGPDGLCPLDGGDELLKKWKVQLGQCWSVGRHLLYCGDAIEIAPMPVDGIVTDPPYDAKISEIVSVFDRFANRAMLLASDRLAFGLANHWQFRLDLIWKHVRPRKIPTRNVPIIYHTHCVLLTRDANVKTEWKKPTKAYGSIIECEREYEDGAMGHGKAAEVFERAMAGLETWLTVLDPFCGTVPVLIACQNTGRRAIGIEIDPRTVAIALQRCEDAGIVPITCAT